MKKRILAAGLCVALALSMTACGKTKSKTATSGELAQSSVEADMSGTDYKSKVTLGEYKGLKVAESIDSVDETVLKKIDCLLVTSGYFNVDTSVCEQKTGTVEEFDIVNIDYVGKLDGEAFEGGTANNYFLGIGTNTFIEGFEEGLKGVKTGETKDLNLKFPDDYQNTEMAGKEVVFTVKVNYIFGVNDEFVKTNSDEIFYFLHEYFLNGQHVNTADEYKEAVREGVRVSNIASAIIDDVTSGAQVEIDEAELKTYLDGIKAPIIEAADKNNTDFETLISYYYGYKTVEEFDEYYKGIFKNYVILMKIAKEEGLKLSDEHYLDVVQALVDHSNGNYKNVADYEANNSKQEVVDDTICGKVYYKLAEYVKFVPDSEIETKEQASE